MRSVPNKQKFSLLGSVTDVSAVPATWIALFRLAKDSLFGPPSVPRSVITPFANRKEWVTVSPGNVENPSIWPLSLMA
jgi:hypothetical protein